MRITITDRLRAMFARDEYEFWWRHFTDEEKKLRQMDAWQLAEIISKSGRDTTERILAEHLLNVRLTRMQIKVTYINIVFGFVGVIIGAVLSSIL